ncbi:MAG: hypothetical protein JWM73_2584 [Solirubrobacterales bacterium]|nr:hypothetical protein [Solirubrobacterales bacterium]
MCMQCMAAAMTAGATASGTRSYIAARHFSWVTPARLKRITVGLIAAALVTSSLVFSGSSAPAKPPSRATSSSAPAR